jgi:uncharacterized protein
MEVIGIILFVLFSAAGVLLIFLGTPGTLSILAGCFSYAILTGFSSVDWKMLLILSLMSVFAESSDNILSMLGAKKSGASGRSTWAVLIGSVAGGILGGLAAPVIGSLIGAFIGGVSAPIIMEYMRRKELYPAIKAGVGALLGRLGGILLKFLIAIVMIAIVLTKIF